MAQGFLLWTLVTSSALPKVLALPDTCKTFTDVDIDPHTPGLGSAPGGTISQCCSLCSSPTWWTRGCRFYTLSKGRCWFKASNTSVVQSHGKVSGQSTAEIVPPAPPPPPPRGHGGNWVVVGPVGIGDDINASGESGTLADAASPARNPNIIYAGGQNNGASSGVIKSIDAGKHWFQASSGIFNTRIQSLMVIDDVGDHVLCGVPGGMYETLNGARSWTFVRGSQKLGTCHSFKNGTVLGEPSIFASCDVGIANRPVNAASFDMREWSVIPPGGWGRAGYLTVSDSLVSTSVLGGCIGGHLWIGDVVNRTYANWTQFPDRPCVMAALNPNDKDEFIYTHPPLTYRSLDGGRTFLSCNHSNIFHAGIDRQGWYYTAAMGGAFVSWDQGRSWHGYYDNRTARRTGHSTIRGAHDYQRICLDFGGSVGFVSDQGLFIKPYGWNNTRLELIKANGNMSNNIALKASVSRGDGPGKRYIVTAIWDWAPVASWDSGLHWPSWQTAEDGPGGSCIGEGGGSYGMGTSNHMLLMHHHNILASAQGGKNLTRFVVPGGATVFGPAYGRRPGSRTEPNGAVYAPLFMGRMPWTPVFDKTVSCTGTQVLADLGVQTNYSCVATVDLGTTYGWYKGVTAAIWRGDTDRHCYICNISGNASHWQYSDTKGAITYVKDQAKADNKTKNFIKKYDTTGDGRVDQEDLQKSIDVAPDDDDGDGPDDDDGFPFKDGKWHSPGEVARHEVDEDLRGRGVEYIIKNHNYGQGMNWTWSQLPAHMAGTNAFVTDPTSNQTIYGVAPRCISRSHDEGDSWEPCWEATNLTGTFAGLAIKDSSTMIVTRRGQVPLRTKDGGSTWQPMDSLAVWSGAGGPIWSWTGKTLAFIGSGGQQSTWHPHAGFVWISRDDGDTWVDETAGLVTMAVGAAQWYEGDLYLNTMGEGIFYKTLEEYPLIDTLYV